jgi:hypothetical protein
VEAEIASREIEQVLSLPKEAIRPRSTIWLVDADNRLQILDVEVLQFGGKDVAVMGEFPADMQVIVSALNRVIPGTALQPQVLADEGVQQ